MNEATARFLGKVREALAPVEPSAVTGENEPAPELLEAASADRAEDYGNPPEERTPGPITEPSQPWIDNGAQLRYPAGGQTRDLGAPVPGASTAQTARAITSAPGRPVQVVPPSPGRPRRVNIRNTTAGTVLLYPENRAGSDSTPNPEGFPLGMGQAVELTTQGAVWAASSTAGWTLGVWVDYDPLPVHVID